MQLQNLHPFAFHLNFWKCQAGKTCCLFWSHFFDFNHPGSPSLQPHHANGMLLPRSPCQWFWRSNIQWISSHKLKPATPKATTIHTTHPPSATTSATAQTPAQRLAFVFFFVEDFPGIKGMKGTNIILEDEGNTCQGFFCSTDVSHVANVGWPISKFPIRFRGDFSTTISLSPKEGNLQMWSENSLKKIRWFVWFVLILSWQTFL